MLLKLEWYSKWNVTQNLMSLNYNVYLLQVIQLGLQLRMISLKHRPLTLTFLILRFHTGVAATAAWKVISCSCYQDVANIAAELLPLVFQKICHGCWIRPCAVISTFAEHLCSVDVPWLLNSTINNYSCYCRALVYSRCTMQSCRQLPNFGRSPEFGSFKKNSTENSTEFLCHFKTDTLT